MKFVYFNDTNRTVNVHPATFIHGTTGEKTPIKPLEERIFTLPEGTFPWVKMWDYGEIGLSILVSPMVDVEEESNCPPKKEKYTDISAIANHIWEEILKSISQKVTKPTFDTWFKDTEGEFVNGTLVITCANYFQRDWIEEKYYNLILEIARDVVGRELELNLLVEEEETI